MGCIWQQSMVWGAVPLLHKRWDRYLWVGAVCGRGGHMGWVQRSGQLRLRHRRGGGVDRRLCVGVRVVGGAVDGDGSLRMADTRDQTNEKDICASTWMRWGVQAG